VVADRGAGNEDASGKQGEKERGGKNSDTDANCFYQPCMAGNELKETKDRN